MTDFIDISHGAQAPSTKRSQEPPAIPPIANSPYHFAPSTPPLSLGHLAKTTDGRHIPKPIALSNRPFTARLTPDNSNKLNIADAFLFQEPVEIFAIRQRLDRAWQTRLLICVVR